MVLYIAKFSPFVFPLPRHGHEHELARGMAGSAVDLKRMNLASWCAYLTVFRFLHIVNPRTRENSSSPNSKHVQGSAI